jgi:hypothetical protein
MRQGIEVRRPRRFQLRLAPRLDGQAAQAVGHEQDDFRLRWLAQPANEIVNVHARSLPVCAR